MNQNAYISYHIDPRAFREKGEQNRLDEPVEVVPSKEDEESVLNRLRAPYSTPPKPTKLELETLIREGLCASEIADRCQASLIRVQNWLQVYKIHFKKLAAERYK